MAPRARSVVRRRQALLDKALQLGVGLPRLAPAAGRRSARAAKTHRVRATYTVSASPTRQSATNSTARMPTTSRPLPMTCRANCEKKPASCAHVAVDALDQLARGMGFVKGQVEPQQVQRQVVPQALVAAQPTRSPA